MNLATLAQVKAYNPQSTLNLDTVIEALLPRASEHVRRWLGRDVPKEIFVNRRLTGSGSTLIILPAYPIVELTRLNLFSGSKDVTESDGQSAGYLLDSDIGMISLVGGNTFSPQALSTICSWSAGYRTQEATTLAGGVFTPATGGQAGEIDRVTYTANGATLVAVTSNPAAGQYTFNVSSGQLGFNSSDNGQSITARYWYVPLPIVQACCELVTLKLKQRDNIGVQSRSIGDESVTYESRDFTPSIKAMLEPYRRRVPI